MRGLLLLFLLLPGVVLHAQLSDSLRGVEVRSVMQRAPELKQAYQPGSSGNAIDSGLRKAYDQQQLSTLLTMATTVFVRSYGINSLATLSFRGASAAQSAVLWEGIPLMNAATGISDLSLLPVGFTDSIAIRYGGSGALDGSGNVGGALLLQSRQPRFSSVPRVSGFLQAGFGSFSQLPLAAGAALSTRRLEARLRLVRQAAANDFPATDQSGQPFRTTHAAMRGFGTLAELSYKLSGRDLLRAHVWLQDYHREIPRALFEQYSDKKQDEATSRYLIQYSHTGHIWQGYAKLAAIREWFHYQMPSVRIKSDIETSQVFAEAGAERGIGRWGRILVFVPVTVAKLSSVDTLATQRRVGIAGAWRRSWSEGRLQTAVNVRAEQVDASPFLLPGLGLSWAASPLWTLRLNLQRSYRAPTLNERFYVPGGNPDLKAEQGWSGEGGYVFDCKLAGGWTLHHELTAYARLVDNWIIWLGGAIWTPHNLAQVFSRGLETSNTLDRRFGSWQLRAGLGLAYTRSTPTESLLPNDKSIGRQIPFTPAFTGNVRIAAGRDRLNLEYLQSFAGRRYITSDESSWLPAYHTADIIGSYTVLKRPVLQAQLSIRNAFDRQYAVVAARPMPGRNFLAGLRLEF